MDTNSIDGLFIWIGSKSEYEVQEMAVMSAETVLRNAGYPISAPVRNLRFLH